jgi:PAS domain S-box-containing protein
MKISHKLICGYLIISLVMSVAGYLSIKIFNDIKHKVVELKKDSIGVLGSSNELLRALENSQKSLHALIENKPRIIYSYSNTSSKIPPKAETRDQVEKRLKADLDKIEDILLPLTKTTRLSIQSADKPRSEMALKEWLNLRKKHFYYHWKYLSYFINLSDEMPEQAISFFEKTLEPHYRENIFPVINKYRESEQKEKERLVRKIIEDYIPNASNIIISSTLATLLSVFLLGFWILRSVSTPLSRLSTAALDIGRGQLDTRIDIKSKDEVGILADAFNRMTNDLSKTTVSKSYVENIIKSMLDMLIVVIPDGTIIKVNKSTRRLLDYTGEELIGTSIKNIILEEKTEKDSVIDELVYRSSVGNIEKTYLTKDGVRIPVLFSGAVMHNDNGRIQGIVCVARDIIDRKRSEIALQNAYDEMERRVEERTAELLKANRDLKREIQEHMQTEEALRESENRLRLLSSHILTAQEKERKRLSLELHDDLGQSLSLLKVQISSIQPKLGEDRTSVFESLQEIRQYLNFVIENVRRLSRDLSPSIIEDLGLSAAIQWLISDFTKHNNIKTSMDIEDISDFFSLEKQIVIYRIFQEILTNIGKHSKAERLTTCIKREEGLVSFVAEDNGKGFDLKEVLAKHSNEKGMGLAAMQERTLMLGSPLNILTCKGKGTKIAFMIPIESGESR